MSEEIIEFKPGIGPLKVDVVALWRRLFSKPKNDPTKVVAQRFLQIFKAHGVPVTQIPRLVPKLTLDKLNNLDSLLPVLTNDVLDSVAKIFRIRRRWLDGVGDQIYDTLWCYKAPENLFEEIGALDLEEVCHPIAAICSTKRLDAQSGQEQAIALVLKEKLCDLDDEEIHRYRIFEDGWLWDYWKSRIQLKAMARVVDKVLNDRVPFYYAEPKVLEAIESGQCVPRLVLKGRPLQNMSLEDFALWPEESAQSKDSEELPQVLEYIKVHDLENRARQVLQKKHG